jgi:hypothetical protein
MSFDESEFTLSTSDLFDVLSATTTAASTTSTIASTTSSSRLTVMNTELHMRAPSDSPQPTPMSGELPDPAHMRQQQQSPPPPVPTQVVVAPDNTTIPHLANARDAQFRSVSELVAEQRHALMCGDTAAFASLAEREAALSGVIAAQLEQLRRLDIECIVEPAQLGAWQFLCSDLSLQLQQLQLLEDELRATAAQQSCAALMALVIQSQPFPSVVAKGRRLLEAGRRRRGAAAVRVDRHCGGRVLAGRCRARAA